VFHRGRFTTEVALAIPGPRPALSALAAVAVCDRLGVEPRMVRDALEDFSGLSRDFELRGSFRGVTLIDDASEGPREVAEALVLARRLYRRRRLCAVFAAPEDSTPGAVRRYVDALATADRVLVTPAAACPDQARMAAVVAERLTATGVPARWKADLTGTISELDRLLEPGDVLLTLGAGEVGTIADALIRRLPRDRPGG
jgi:UDP-N-acetylmuramate--alanine ligase